MRKEIPDEIELAAALRRASSTTSPESLTFDKRTGAAKLRVSGAFTADGLRAILRDLERIESAIEIVTR